MPLVKFTPNLRRFFPELKSMTVEARSVAEALEAIEQSYAGIKDYIVEENGTLRKHVNIFIGSDMIKDRTNLRDELSDSDEIYIMQALSGG